MNTQQADQSIRPQRGPRCSWWFLALAGLGLGPGCSPSPPPPADMAGSCHAPAPAGTRVLVYTRTTGYRHASIPEGVAAIEALGARLQFAVEVTEDPGQFTDTTLARFAAVIFLNTTGDVLPTEGEGALERYVLAGGGFVGVHAAADTEYEWPGYGELLGTWFLRHPAVQLARADVVDTTHPSTRCLPVVWRRTDEWYDFRSLPRAGARILVTLDESSYQGAVMGPVHPAAWYQAVGQGRSWYTAMGHTAESYREREYLDHLAGGILWAVGVE